VLDTNTPQLRSSTKSWKTRGIALRLRAGSRLGGKSYANFGKSSFILTPQIASSGALNQNNTPTSKSSSILTSQIACSTALTKTTNKVREIELRTNTDKNQTATVALNSLIRESLGVRFDSERGVVGGIPAWRRSSRRRRRRGAEGGEGRRGAGGDGRRATRRGTGGKELAK
jgi:hypothetical protein